MYVWNDMIASKKLKLNILMYMQQIAHAYSFFDFPYIVQRNLEDSFLKSSKDFIL